MVESQEDNTHAVNVYNSNLEKLSGGEHFVHVGNLVRGEEPYKEMLRENRQKLFYALFLLARFAKFNVLCATSIKKETKEQIFETIADSIIDLVNGNAKYFAKYNEIILHYDHGQHLLSGVLLSSFKSKFRNTKLINTPQTGEPFMQAADLFAYFELLKYKIENYHLSKSEIAFFGHGKKIKRDYFSLLDCKYLK